jgi:hypothetical protein
VRLLELNCICAPTAIARREIWQRALPVPDGLAFNDWYFNVMMARMCDFYYVDYVLADYRVHSHNHHMKIAQDKTEETSIFSVLERVFNEVESSVSLQDAKCDARNRIYSRQYLTLADKYFGFGLDRDARRCYLNAIRHYPAHFFNVGLQRRLAATIVGRQRYESGKALMKTALARGSR